MLFPMRKELCPKFRQVCQTTVMLCYKGVNQPMLLRTAAFAFNDLYLMQSLAGQKPGVGTVNTTVAQHLKIAENFKVPASGSIGCPGFQYGETEFCVAKRPIIGMLRIRSLS